MTNVGDMNRRRAMELLAALAVGVASPLGGLENAGAAKPGKEKTRKSGSGKGKGSSKDKGSKHNKSKKKQSSGGGNATGSDVVHEAEKYKGAKYTMGGASPKGFDCSGFTWYVYNRVAGMDISRTVADQYKQGKSVQNGSWKAGDIVFFKNTFEKGLSHCGIYISGNKFIHAENEKTGVVISVLDSDYYKDHYAGARRLL